MQHNITRPANFDVNAVIKQLPQTTDGISQAIDSVYPGYGIGILTEQEHEAIKAAVYRCVRCGFWNVRSDMSEEFEVCVECKENESSYQ